VRGFESNSIGPRDIITNDPLGGTRRLIGNAELLFGLPGAMQDKSFRLSVFADTGTIWDKGDKFSASMLRYSTGMAISWSSPMGPLKLSFAKPINAKPEDKKQSLQFQFGSIF
jgi:outer membrane protein insertion porin family